MRRWSLFLLVVVGGCPGPSDAPQFTASISGATGANNMLSSMTYTEFAGSVSPGPPVDLTTFHADNPFSASTSTCSWITMGGVGRPVAGTSYHVIAGQAVSFGSDTTPGDADLVYCERPDGCHGVTTLCWAGSGGGTIDVTSVSGMQVGIRFTHVPMTSLGTPATGTLMLSGSGTTRTLQ